ncbi:pantoate--beta-alanine ligase [Caryophanon tenue]|uniref:Pantothenate synthetase n=1 Tax=Caryophanon tenue TaxID=33978 RepID=A0A1C0Y585_9BACL|nr:pantoate--beta-alanine ligase [Caryophanon tenue]OCS82311.1 pantoate--beta-alanine ligase [Caryophanon tenue]
MQVLKTIAALQTFICNAKRQQQTIGFVPTMGALHDGHLTLAKAAREEHDIAIMSVFVNPTQFGPNEDFDAYPRDLARDVALATSVGVDAIFAPSVAEMYPHDGGIRLHAGRQATMLCGASRPGHFDGVLQVVAKLFHLVQPDVAYFGQKDAQQVAIIETMVRDFNFPVVIRSVPIVREDDGLAKSSRNMYLTETERVEAPQLYAALQLAKDVLLNTHHVEKAIDAATAHITTHTTGRIDYIEVLSYPDLAPVDDSTTQVVLALAVYIGKTRLIDNLMINLGGN